MCESSRYRQEKRQMTAFSLRARLHLDVSSSLALSLPQSRLCILWARQLCLLAVLRSCFGYSLSHLRTAAACLSRCILHRRRSKAKPLRGSRGRSRANAQIHLRAQLLAPHSQGFFPIHRTAIQRRTAPQAHSPKAPRSISPRQGCCRWRRFR